MINKEKMVKKIMDMEESFHNKQVHYHLLLNTLNKINYFNTIKIYNEYAEPNNISTLSLNTKEDNYSHGDHVNNILKILPNNMQKDFLFSIINNKELNETHNLFKALNDSVNMVNSKLTILEKIENINNQENSNEIYCKITTNILNKIGCDEFVKLYNDYAIKNKKYIIYENVFSNDENKEMNLSVEISNIFSKQKDIEEQFVLHIINNYDDKINLLNDIITNYEQKINSNKKVSSPTPLFKKRSI